VDFDYSDDQKFLKDEARKFLAAHCDVSVVRGVLDNPERAFDEKLWKGVAEQGWLGASIPEEFGGLGLGRVELCAIAEELGRAVAPIPFASTVYVLAEGIMAFGSDAQKASILPRVAAGELIGCLATSEGPGVVGPASLQCRVEGGKLSGTKIPVTDGDVAGVALVLASEGGRPGLFLVDLTGAGVKRETLKSLDPTRSVAKLTFAGAAAERVGDAGAGFEIVQAILDRAAVLLAAPTGAWRWRASTPWAATPSVA
jgi:alkylation response protein AidB-like acyl-CoA dehydrogenase